MLLRPWILATGLSALFTTVAEARSYTFTPLGAAAGQGAGGAVNDRGHAAAGVYVDGQLHALIFRGNHSTDLGPGGVEAFNDADQVAGYVETANLQRHAAVWTHGQLNDLGDFGSGFAMANGINDAGLVVGTMQGEDGFVAFSWQNGTMTPLTTFGSSNALGVGQDGAIVGYSLTTDGLRATLWADGKTPTNLGSLGGISQAFAVNRSRQVVGNYAPVGGGQMLPFSWVEGTMTALPTLANEGTAYAVADCGAIVGESNADPTGPGNEHAVLWENGKLIDLQPYAPAGWKLQYATSIDDQGQIFGWGTDNGQMQPFLLTPKR